MKILVVCQYYAPEPFRITDICEELVQRGHEVTVVTGVPNYPMGEIYPEYQKGQRRHEVVNGVTIHRCYTIGRRKGVFFRFLNYYSYAISSTRYLKKMQDRYDVVFVNQLSPVMMANGALAYKKKHHVPVVLYCLDLWPESLISGGIGRNSIIYKYFDRVSGKIYRNVDKILITSQSFAEYFKEKYGIETTYLPQYAEALFTPEQCRKEPDEYIDLMFAGNIGAAQSVQTIIKAAELTADIPNLRWHIVGDGSELDNMKNLAAKLDNVIFHGRKNLDEMPKYYAMADAMLVTMQKDPVLSMTLPGKVQTYMAAGKPIIGAIDGETKLVIEEAQCGFCCDAEDAVGLGENVRQFVNCNKQSFAYNVREYYEAHFDSAVFHKLLEFCLKQQRSSRS